jgi:hypothetical protein
MPVTKDAPAPYAPAKTVLDIMDRYRGRGLPVPITAEVLARASVPESLIARTIQSLRILDLIDANGMPADAFEAIRLAPEADLKATLAKWLEATYADILQLIDPATTSDANLADAFRYYQPQGQQPRMITLFTGLFRAAGIGPEKPKAEGRPRIVRAVGNAAGSAKVRATSQRREPPPPAPTPPALHPALTGLLASLPRDGSGWTRPDRDRFLNAVGAVLDFAVPLIEPPPVGAPAPEPEDEDA